RPALGKSRLLERQMQPLPRDERMEPTANGVFRDDFHSHVRALQVPAEAGATKDRIIRKHGPSTPKRTAKSEIDLAGIVPGAARVWLLEPRHAVRRGLEPTARSAIVLLAGIPISIIGLGRPGVQKRPRAEGRRVAEPKVGRVVARMMERVIEHRPAAHL